MTGKYVIVDNFFPVLLSDAMGHDALQKMNVTSAGFFKVYKRDDGNLDIAVHGESVSLSLAALPTDAQKIRTLMKMKHEVNNG